MVAEHQKTPIEQKKHVVIRFAGDSGDGMQLTGMEFTRAAAFAGNDIATFPDFPAEIRAPQGTLAGVSGFQLHFSSEAIFTPGDAPDVLVAMNPAALKRNLHDLKKGGLLILNEGAFNEQNLEKVGYKTNPMGDGSLEGWRVVPIDMAKHVANALEGVPGVTFKEIARSKNFWALGLMYWLYNRPIDKQLEWISQKFKKSPELADSNIKVFKAGWAFGETTELFHETYQVAPAPMETGRYRNVIGNECLALGLVTASQKAGIGLMYGAYPITPASDVLHNMAKFRNFGVTTFQAEDEIAAMGAALGASFGGLIGVAVSSGPGFALKSEALGLAVMMELPVVVIDIQRGGPSTGLPTKTEQSDLLLAMYGRNGESPVAIIAAQSPVDCFDAAVEAVRMAIKYMHPVVIMSDGYIANGSEPWKVPNPDSIPPIVVNFRTEKPTAEHPFNVYARNATTLAREWVKPGTPGLEHRVGGLEKDATTGAVNYEPANHGKMIATRAEKIARMRNDVPVPMVEGAQEGDLLVVGWGGTYGSLRQTTLRMVDQGKKVGHLHLRWLNPLPADLEKIFARFKKVIVCEWNLGQLWRVLRAEYLLPALSYTKVQGTPFTTTELEAAFEKALKG